MASKGSIDAVLPKFAGAPPTSSSPKPSTGKGGKQSKPKHQSASTVPASPSLALSFGVQPNPFLPSPNTKAATAVFSTPFFAPTGTPSLPAPKSSDNSSAPKSGAATPLLTAELLNELQDELEQARGQMTSFEAILKAATDISSALRIKLTDTAERVTKLHDETVAETASVALAASGTKARLEALEKVFVAAKGLMASNTALDYEESGKRMKELVNAVQGVGDMA